MELRDLIVTPVVLLLVYTGAYFLRPYVTDSVNRVYFFPGLTVRIVGALAVGFIYQFYYNGGDTFNFHTQGSRIIYNAFVDDFQTGLRLLFSSGEYDGSTFEYASKIPFYKDSSSFAVIRIATIFDLLTFSSYSATAILFAVLSFAGLWLLFNVVYYQYPHLHKPLAVACFFIPSVFFWGSGLLKDTITLAATCVSVYCAFKLAIVRPHRSFLGLTMAALLSLYLLYLIKIYILLILLPCLIVWVFLNQISNIKNQMMKIVVAPIVIFASLVLAGFSLIKASEDDPRYAVDAIARTAKTTAYDIRFWTGRDAGSGYTLGELDGSFNSLIKLAPQAINVTLFRPYPWEVNNILMVMSSFESTVFLFIVLALVIRSGRSLIYCLRDPMFIFCLGFSMAFAFGVGVSTFNFGTLSRYKIPLLPFFAIALVLISYHSKRAKKFSELEDVE